MGVILLVRTESNSWFTSRFEDFGGLAGIAVGGGQAVDSAPGLEELASYLFSVSQLMMISPFTVFVIICIRFSLPSSQVFPSPDTSSIMFEKYDR